MKENVIEGGPPKKKVFQFDLSLRERGCYGDDGARAAMVAATALAILGGVVSLVRTRVKPAGA